MYVVLTFRSGAERGEVLAIPFGSRVTVGRSSAATRKVDDSHLSRVHFEVDCSGPKPVVRDLDSRNGTFVNGVKIDGARALVPGDRLLAGEQVWHVGISSEPSGLADDYDDTTAYLDAPKACSCCGHSISLATFADGEVLDQDGKYVCPDCAVVVGFEDRTFEGFQILDRLGAGSAGLVFKARQVMLDRVVALKVLRQRRRRTKRSEARFVREAATISRLQHPNIVRIYDASPFPQGYYLVMEYFEAVDLRTLVERRGVPSVAVAVSVGIQVSRALDHAGSEGIVHRDVKPANILYRPSDGVAKLTDFGLAKRVGVSAGTRDGEGVGTPCYMAPEQVRDAKSVDPRADIYGLGATLYHLLTGQYPVVARTMRELVASIVEHDPPPIETVNPKVPPPVAEVIRRAMRKKPRQRFKTGGAMHDALEAVRRDLGLPPPPPVEGL